jgi:hydrogenase maturation protease
MRHKILVVGLGNILLRDEGIGVHAVQILKDRFRFSPGIEIVDGGTLGLDLLPLLEKRDGVLFVDAVDFGREPGYVGEIEGDGIPSKLQMKLSAHHVGLSDLLLAATWMDMKPERIGLIGVQPESVEVGLEMTERIKGKTEELLGRAIARLEEWGVKIRVNS